MVCGPSTCQCNQRQLCKRSGRATISSALQSLRPLPFHRPASPPCLRRLQQPPRHAHAHRMSKDRVHQVQTMFARILHVLRTYCRHMHGSHLGACMTTHLVHAVPPDGAPAAAQVQGPHAACPPGLPRHVARQRHPRARPRPHRRAARLRGGPRRGARAVHRPLPRRRRHAAGVVRHRPRARRLPAQHQGLHLRLPPHRQPRHGRRGQRDGAGHVAHRQRPGHGHPNPKGTRRHSFPPASSTAANGCNTIFRRPECVPAGVCLLSGHQRQQCARAQALPRSHGLHRIKHVG